MLLVPRAGFGVGLGGRLHLSVLLIRSNKYSRGSFNSEINSRSTGTCILPHLVKGDQAAHRAVRYQPTRGLGEHYILLPTRTLSLSGYSG